MGPEVDTLTISRREPPGMEGYTFPQELWISINREPPREIFKSMDVAIPPEVAFHPSRHLLGEPHPDLALDGRAAVLVCSECGDIGCGALFVRIEVGTDWIRWTDFLYGNNYDPDEDDPRPGDYEFDRDSYERALSDDGQPVIHEA